MDAELIHLLKSPEKDAAAKGAAMLASFLSRASFPSKSVQALREVLPPAPLQRIFNALSLRLVDEVGCKSLVIVKRGGFNSSIS